MDRAPDPLPQGPWAPDDNGIQWVHSLQDLLDFIIAIVNDESSSFMLPPGITAIRLASCPFSRAQISLQPPPFPREAAAPSQQQAQQSMFCRATRGGSWPVPSADPVEGTGFTAQDFYRLAAGESSGGLPIRPTIQELFEDWGHVFPEEFFQDSLFAIERVVAQIIVTAFGVHPDVTQTTSPGSPLLEVDWADWAANSPGIQQYDAANISQRGTMGFHAILPGWTPVPPRGHAQPHPTLIEVAFAAMGGGTGPERANAKAVRAAAVATDQLPDGRLRLSGQDRVDPQTPIPHLDRARWHSAMDSLPVHMRAALTLAAEAAQHSVCG